MNWLEGIRFTDLTWAGAGPFGTKLFADFGAEVIKVESASRLDPVRAGGPFKDGKPGVNRSGYFASRNTGKKSLTLDLKSERGRDLVLELIRRSDVVTNNFAPGAMDRLGLGYAAVREVAPTIVYLEMPMYGADGPRAAMAGVGMTISAVTGQMWQTAYGPDDPVGPGTHYPDHAANCHHAAFAVMAALRRRRLTGEGCRIDLSQVESTLNFMGGPFLQWASKGEEPAQVGNRSLRHCPHDVYRARGEDDWVAVAVECDRQWQALAAVLGGAALDTGLAAAAARLERSGEVDRLVADWVGARDGETAANELRAAGVPAAVVASSRHLVERDAQLQARGYWQTVAHPEIGETLYTSPPYRIDDARVRLQRPPLMGEHNDAVLGDVLGLPPAEIDRLVEDGVVR